MKRIISQLLLLVGLTLLFNACGGGGSSTTSFTAPSGGTIEEGDPTSSGNDDDSSDGSVITDDRETKSGTKVLFVDTFCSGVSYTGISVDNTITGTGTTGTDGYAYIPEGSAYIQFELGGLVLGKVRASQVITITELFRNSNLDDNRVMFAARLLLTLDEDSDASNGIQISESVSQNIAYFEGTDAIDNYKLTTLNRNEEEVTAILTELVAFLNIQNEVVSQESARTHLEDSMDELEEGVFTQIIKAGENDNCPNGGIARVHRVDFDKTDDNTTPREYIDYFCDETTTFDQKKHFTLSKGNEKCPDGGIKIRHKLYTESTRIDSSTQNEDNRLLVAEYDEYKCKGAEAYKHNTFIVYRVDSANDNCDNIVKKSTQTKKENNISVISNGNEYICVDSEDGNYVELATLVKDSVCLNGGVRVDYFIDNSKTEFVSSSYYCNQATERGYVQGEHNIVAVDANDTVCPHGGKELKHSVDYDNNGELDTFYSEVKCDDYNGSADPSLKVRIFKNELLLEDGMSDFSKCPYGGYRIEKVMKQGDNIIAEWNDYNCTDTTNLVKDNMTPVTLRASDYNSTTNHWCPNGGIKYNHKVYFNEVLNHEYYDINCSPATTAENNTSTTLEIGNSVCPYGGEIVTHSVVFNGDDGHPSNYEYNSTHCNGFEYNQTTETVTELTDYSYSDVNVDCKVELHQRFLDGTHIPAFDYNTTTCTGLEWNQTTVGESSEDIAVGSEICPDGGQKITYTRSKPDGTVIDEWTYSVVICDGLDYNETKEVNDTARTLLFGDTICPYGGKVVTHKRFTKDTNEHVARWDYNTTTCNSLEYNATEEEVSTVKIYILGDGNTICPDGGVVKNHKRYMLDENSNRVYVPYWDFNTTVCTGLDYNQTEDIPLIVDRNPSVCPYGGKVTLHKRYTKDGGVHIPRWDYNTTTCNSLEYNQTVDVPVEVTLAIGNAVCPDGGKIVHHKRYADTDGDGQKDDHIADWDYSETICNGLDYNKTVEKQVVTNWAYGENEICPDGGQFIQHQRYLDDDQDGVYTANVDTVRITKWDYNTTHCIGLDYNGTTEEKSVETLAFGSEICPDGGERITHKFFIMEDGEKTYIDKWEYTNVVCVGLDFNKTEDQPEKEIWGYGESEVCPDGGEFVQHKFYADLDGDGTYETHVAKWDYNTTECKGLDYNETEEFTSDVDASSTVCPDGGKVITHERWTVDEDGNQVTHIAKWDYTSTVCEGLDWNMTTEQRVIAETHAFGSDICPDSGITYTYQRWLGVEHIAKWDYNVTICNGLDWNETIDDPIETTLAYGDVKCPDGGKFVQHRVFADLDGDGSYETHVNKWDYNTTNCTGLDYNQTTSEEVSVPASTDVCPDGGEVITHKRYILDVNSEKVYIDKWEYNTTECKGLDYNQTIDFPIEHTLSLGDAVCPDGGKFIEHQRWTVDNSGAKVEHIAKWDYNTTHCVGLDYNQTEECGEPTVWAFGDSSICPDGGVFFEHKRCLIGTDTHVAKWDYNTTTCSGLDYNQTEDRPVVTTWGYGDSRICPDGGTFVQHKRFIKGTDTHVAKWDYNTTTCSGLDYNQTEEFTSEIDASLTICPDGGKVITHERWTVDGDGNKVTHIAKWDYNSTVCTGLDYNQTLKHEINVSIPMGSTTCPDGGTQVTTIRYVDNGDGVYNVVDDRKIDKWTFTSVYCTGLDYNQTLKHEINTTIEIGSEVCPDGGTFVQTIRYIDTNNNSIYDEGTDEHIAKWDFNSTYCKGLDYNETLKHEINTTIEAGSEVCPDGGTFVQTIRYIDINSNSIYDEGTDEHIAKWDFNSTYCEGLEYNQTLEHNESATLDPDPKVCPFGGEEITHIRYIDVNGDEVFTDGTDTKIDKWTFKTTHCSEGDQNDNTNEIILPVGDQTCPDGGKIVEHNVTNNGVEMFDYSETRCGREGVSYDVGLDSNFSVAGYVKDINGTRIVGATVYITVNGRVYEVITGVNGVYQFYNVTKGSTVSISADGYIPVTGLTVTSSILDVVLIPSSLSYVQDLDLIFFPIDREIGADKALEYAEVKGWRLLTFSELLALYYSDRRSEFTGHEYFSSTNELDAYGIPVGNEDGYTLWTLDFSNGNRLAQWFSWRKHVVFTNVSDQDSISAREFTETDDWADWYTANSICSADNKRLPTIEEIKTIYFNSGHPVGIADEDITGGEYWTLDVVTNVDEDGDEYKSAKFFRVVGPVEDYYIEKYANPENPKKVLCVTPDATEEATVSGIVKDWSGKALYDVRVNFRVMDYEGNRHESYTATTANDGTYSITIPASRYYVEFDPTEYASQIMSTDYSTESMTLDLRVDTVLDMNFTAPNTEADYNNDSDGVCDDTAPECERVAFEINSNLDTDSDTWTYSVIKTADANVNMSYFTLKLSSLCMEQITDLQGGEPIALNGLGIVDGIKSTNGQISFIVHSSAEYDPDVDTPLTISTDNGQRLSANIATPVCFYLDEENSVAGNVIDTYGNAVAGATVTAVTTYTGPDGNENEEYEFTTDNSGAFTSEVVINLKNETVSGSFLAEKVGYDSLADAQKSVTLERDVVNQVGTLVLKPQPINVTGVVKSTDGDTLSGVTVVISDKDGNELTSIVTDVNGAYSYSTEVGTKLSIEASLELYSTENIALTTISPTLHEFNLELDQLFVEVNVTSSVVDKATDEIISGANVIVEKSDGTAIATTDSNESGEFIVSIRKGVSESFGIVLKASATGYSDGSLTLADLPNGSVTLNPIKLEAKPSTINVTVEDEDWNSLNNASVNLYVEGDQNPIKQATTLADGIALLENLEAGSYRLSVSLSGYNESSIPVSVERGQTRYVYITMVEDLENSATEIISAVSQGIVNKYDKDGVKKGSSKFEVTSYYTSETGIWTYTVNRIAVRDAGAELSHWVLDLDDTCIAHLVDVTTGAETGQDKTTGIENGLKWNTTGGTFSFRVDAEFDASTTIFVPVALKAGTVGDLENEGMTLIMNLPGPICN